MMKNKSFIHYTILSSCFWAPVVFAQITAFTYDKDLAQYPSGLAIGATFGQGYLSTHESNNINDNLATNVNFSQPIIAKKFTNGHFIWDVYGAYDSPFTERLLMGVAVGYKSLGKSTGSANSNVPIPSNAPALGNATSYTYSDSQIAVDFLLTGRLYIWEKYKGLNMFAKAGAAYVRANDSVRFYGTITQANISTTVAKRTSSSATIWRIEPEFDLGLGYSINQHVDLHVMYTYIGGTDGNTATAASSPSGLNIPWEGVFAYNALSGGFTYSFG